MAALRAPALLIALSLTVALRASPARAADEPDDVASTATFQDERFGPRYVIDSVVVRGNHKTQKSISSPRSPRWGWRRAP